LMIERGIYRRTNCRVALEVAADGADHPVADQPLFNTMSVRFADPRHALIVQKIAAKVVWRGTYTVSKDRRSMTLAFEDDRAVNAVTGVIEYSREGDPVNQAHALSGTWRPKKLTAISASGLTMTIREVGDGLLMSWGDGRNVESRLNADYYPLNGYLEGAKVSILNPRPDTLAINREQGGVVPVEVSRAIISDDGQAITFKQADWICEGMTIFTYRRAASN
jgi:hypothetical protein